MVAVLALPIAAIVATLLLADPRPPQVPPLVRIGESATLTPSPAPQPGTQSPSADPPSRSQLPPPPPVDDDDDDDDDDDLFDDDVFDD
ncbi:pilus assembly protein CpaF/ATP-binding cassette, subfamily B [Prauserella marina]|uniref:Pilus assembly protein CpaF/ATP-binding cassette, subfamily B n=1 Tax=Prauserella marina TaxID=530584 RepID=A0A1G6UPU7_9PSEU|nr:hypothetical protein DES30_10779 [Prauserella marina]SDD43450.1 pilus assembly protein CpaF/ATP-binding cassette, subfamily B [Prauserella marina]